MEAGTLGRVLCLHAGVQCIFKAPCSCASLGYSPVGLGTRRFVGLFWAWHYWASLYSVSVRKQHHPAEWGVLNAVWQAGHSASWGTGGAIRVEGMSAPRGQVGVSAAAP